VSKGGDCSSGQACCGGLLCRRGRCQECVAQGKLCGIGAEGPCCEGFCANSDPRQLHRCGPVCAQKGWAADTWEDCCPGLTKDSGGYCR
jgi:hypothetical protein